MRIGQGNRGEEGLSLLTMTGLGATLLVAWIIIRLVLFRSCSSRRDEVLYLFHEHVLCNVRFVLCSVVDLSPMCRCMMSFILDHYNQ